MTEGHRGHRRHGYVVSRGGTFGVVERQYQGERQHVTLVRWGPLAWLTPVPTREVFQLSSRYEAEARKEAQRLLTQLDTPTPEEAP